MANSFKIFKIVLRVSARSALGAKDAGCVPSSVCCKFVCSRSTSCARVQSRARWLDLPPKLELLMSSNRSAVSYWSGGGIPSFRDRRKENVPLHLALPRQGRCGILLADSP